MRKNIVEKGERNTVKFFEYYVSMIETHYIIKQYKWRWINLILFMAYAINNAIHWAQYSAINDSIAVYYNVPHAFVEWTTGLFTILCYLLFVAPVLYAMEKFVSMNIF